MAQGGRGKTGQNKRKKKKEKKKKTNTVTRRPGFEYPPDKSPPKQKIN